MALQEEMNKQGLWLFRYRSYLPIAILVIAAALYVQMKLHPSMFPVEGTCYETWYEWCCFLVGMVGLVIRIYTVGHTPNNTSGRNTAAGQVADSLNTTGIYSTVRHPLYLGNLFMWSGPALLTGNVWFVVAFLFFYWVYYERIMFAEENYLRGKFGDTYLKWAETTPAFIPRCSNFTKSNLPFSWKKVLRKEKNGLLALFLIFAMFEIAGELVQSGNDYNYGFIGGCAFSALLYIVVKLIWKKTSILREEGR